MSVLTVNSDAIAGDQDATAIAQLAEGSRFVVTWEDGVNYKYRVMNADGTPVTPSTQVNNSSNVGEGEARPANVTALQNGGFVVTWYELSTALQDQDNYSIHAQIYNNNGAEVGSEFVVNSLFTAIQAHSDVIALADGGFAIVWGDEAYGHDYDIAGQVFDAFGARRGGQFLANTTTDNQIFPHITALADGRLAVVWDAYNSRTVRTQIIDPREGEINGSTGNNLLVGNDVLGDEINGLDGNDVLYGLKANDQLYGGRGFDRLVGGLGSDYLDGGNNDDILTGGSEQVATWGLLGAVDRLADFNGDGKRRHH